MTMTGSAASLAFSPIRLFVPNPAMPPWPAALVLVCALFLLAPLVAWASDQPPPMTAPDSKALSADESFERGLSAYDARRFQLAVELFEHSYLLSREPSLLFNMAQSWRLSGDCRRARDLYRRFIAEAPQSTDRPRAEEQSRRLGTCGETAAATQPPAPAPVIAAAAPGSVVLDENRHVISQRTTASLIAGVGGGLAVAAGLSAWDARDLSDQSAALVRQGRPWDDGAEALDRHGRAAQTRAIVLASTALVAVAVATILFLRSGRSERTP